MEKGELIQKLIDAYEKAKMDIHFKTRNNAINYLKVRNLQWGVCHFIDENDDTIVTYSQIYRIYPWLEKNANYTPVNVDNGPTYWCKPPFYCDTIEEISKTIDIRLGILKSELEIE